MNYNNDLFSDIDNVAQPQTLDDDFNSTKSEQSFFKHFSEVENALNDIQDELSLMNELYNELGDGKVDKSLTLRRRNEIIELLQVQQNKIQAITSNLNQFIDNDLTAVKGLTVTTSTNVRAFDKFLKRRNEKKLTSKDLSFQRSE
ncbi:hypothetical protein [Staphylococcus pettenkoferi]|uniref:hypothetical protein n=1 Tax=Staphylococcus pettenkoferi TaxID=170573 RepID=UPI0025577066|nr:hypothetical protein [Staphylococcus pettenkoferi]MDK7284292.1 hypothetical protein [Staphylococcus pettenkoferi]